MSEGVTLPVTPKSLEYAITANLMWCDYSPHQKIVIEDLMCWCKMLTERIHELEREHDNEKTAAQKEGE